MTNEQLQRARGEIQSVAAILQETAAGVEVIIMRDGQPVAELVPYRARGRKRQLGFAAGQIEMAEGWERPMTDAFLGGRL